MRNEEKKVLLYVTKYAKEYEVSPCFIMAIIRQESDFFEYSQYPDRDPDKFDIGYMQVSHIASIDTYKEFTGNVYTGTDEEWQNDGLDPDLNIKYGTGYLRIQHNRIEDHMVCYDDVYKDILKSTLSAYNAGHTTKDNEKYVEGVIDGRYLIDGQRRGYEFFATIRTPLDVSGPAAASLLTTYNRQAAYDYAQKYWDEVCSDGYFWDTPGTYISLEQGTNITSMTGYDCAHFVSCCIGNEYHESGGGLDVPSRVLPTYGEPGAAKLATGWCQKIPLYSYNCCPATYEWRLHRSRARLAS